MKRKTPAKKSPAKAGLQLAPYWIIEPTTLNAIESRARIALKANPSRAGAADWKEAASTAQLAQRCVAAGDAEAAAVFSLEAYRFANRAELLEHAAPAVARDAQTQRSRTSGGIEAGKASHKAAVLWHANLVAAARSMIAAGTQKRSVAGILARRLGKSDRIVRAILKKAEII